MSVLCGTTCLGDSRTGHLLNSPFAHLLGGALVSAVGAGVAPEDPA